MTATNSAQAVPRDQDGDVQDNNDPAARPTRRTGRQRFCTSIVDVANGQLLDAVPGRDSKEPTAWLQRRDCNWRFSVRYATLDLSGPYRKVFNGALPWATQIADPFHVIKVANQ